MRLKTPAMSLWALCLCTGMQAQEKLELHFRGRSACMTKSSRDSLKTFFMAGKDDTAQCLVIRSNSVMNCLGYTRHDPSAYNRARAVFRYLHYLPGSYTKAIAEFGEGRWQVYVYWDNRSRMDPVSVPPPDFLKKDHK